MNYRQLIESLLKEINSQEKYLYLNDKVRSYIPVYYDGKRYAIDDCFTRFNRILNSLIERYFKQNVGLSEDLINNFNHKPNFKSKLAKELLSEFKLQLEIKEENEFDNDPSLLNMQNGVVDLKTGKIRERTSSDLFLNVTKASYIENYDDEPEVFIKWISDLFKVEESNKCHNDGSLEYLINPNGKRFETIMSILGYLITGETTEKKMFFVIGAPNSGKSTFISYLTKILGSYASDISIYNLLKKRGSDPDIKPEVVLNRNRRVLFTSEPEKDHIIDASFIKRFTGNDLVQARKQFKANISFKAKGKFIVSANVLPKISDKDDDALYNRLCLLNADNSISLENQDPDFLDKMLNEDISNEVLSYIVKYSIAYYRNNKKISLDNSFVTDKKSYLLSRNDPITTFFNNYVEADNNQFNNRKCYSKAIYRVFMHHITEFGIDYSISENLFQKEFYQLVKYKFGDIKNVSGSSATFYHNLKIPGYENILNELNNKYCNRVKTF